MTWVSEAHFIIVYQILWHSLYTLYKLTTTKKGKCVAFVFWGLGYFSENNGLQFYFFIAEIRISFLFVACSYFTVNMYQSFFVQSSAIEHLAWFYALAIVNWATISMEVKVNILYVGLTSSRHSLSWITWVMLIDLVCFSEKFPCRLP